VAGHYNQNRGEKYMSEIDKLAWLCIKDKKFLGARSKNKTTYYIPGGKREPGETDQAALIREIKEELSVDLITTSIEYVGTFKAQADGKPEGTVVKITCYRGEYAGDIKADAEIEEVKWLSSKDREECSLVTQIILDWLKSQMMIE
jgi:8-oxo-dGTP pyrophosphatase MutT (NUDIX family)